MLTLLSNKRLCIVGIALILCIGTVSYIRILYHRIDNLNVHIINLETKHTLDKRMYEYELSKARATINKQNKAIEDLAFDKVSYDTHIDIYEKQITAETLKEQTDIRGELEKDCSPENQLRIIRMLMEDFSANH